MPDQSQFKLGTMYLCCGVSLVVSVQDPYSESAARSPTCAASPTPPPPPPPPNPPGQGCNKNTSPGCGQPWSCIQSAALTAAVPPASIPLSTPHHRGDALYWTPWSDAWPCMLGGHGGVRGRQGEGWGTWGYSGIRICMVDPWGWGV